MRWRRSARARAPGQPTKWGGHRRPGEKAGATMIAESKLFIKLWLRSPLTMGALMPSSRGLAEAIARQVPKGKGPVIELGGGTGAVTEALLDAGVKREDHFVIELDDELHAVLTRRFAGVR